ncbi:MAG: LTA synthase family protein [Lachnospiraceae bacterium]|nr:LTA synthase family protein [Lachnospiraceae bacterium]
MWLIREYCADEIIHGRTLIYPVALLYLTCAAATAFFAVRGGDGVLRRDLALFDAAWLLVAPVAAVYVEELMWNAQALAVPLIWILYNALIFLAIEAVLFLITSSPRAVVRVTLGFAALFGIVNRYVLEFKGNPFMPSEISAAGTALGVLSGYELHLTNGMVRGGLLLLLALALIAAFPPRHVLPVRAGVRLTLAAAGLLLLAGSVFFVRDSGWEKKIGLKVNGWAPGDNFIARGAPVCFLYLWQEGYVRTPGGYSAGEAESLLNRFAAEDMVPSGGERPSIIVVMNESFTDFSVVGNLTSGPYIDRFNAIDDFFMRGYVYVSVNGGGTCNSEFEFLTGSTMSFFNSNIFPYTSYDFSGTYSIADELNRRGYETVAMHPNLGRFWNRNEAYGMLDFQKFITIEQMENIEYFRFLPSDKYNYDQIIKTFEEKTGPIFLFDITMQNHGGYELSTLTGSGREPVSVEGEYQKYETLQTFLTLMDESDKAFAYLLDYFREQDEPVIVCFFGDHQPAIEGGVYELLGQNSDGAAGVGKREHRFKTPYLIWTNTAPDAPQKMMDMSLNYLGAQILEMAGVETDYGNYLEELQKEIPVVNSVGFQTADGIWHDFSQTNENLLTYEKMQYYQMFDRRQQEN